MMQLDFIIFQMGWFNHQLDKFDYVICIISDEHVAI